MKRILSLLLALLLVCTAALADTYVVNTQGSILTLWAIGAGARTAVGGIPDGTVLEVDPARSTGDMAFVTYGELAGWVEWQYLTAPVQTTPTPTPVPEPPAPSGYTVLTVGAYLQLLDSRNNPITDKWPAATVGGDHNLLITADIPAGQKLAYWVINGARYDFQRTVTSIRMTDVSENFVVEAVCEGAEPRTLYSPEMLQQLRTGAQLVLSTKNAELAHMKDQTTAGGGWIRSFDFTYDYVNRATNLTEPGGQISAKVRARIPEGRYVRGWKFNDTRLYLEGRIEQFVVFGQSANIVYEPIFGGSAPTPEPARYTVKCSGCRFSGGGYSNATSGTVYAGTPITVTSDYGDYTYSWTVNGSTTYGSNTTISRTINQNTTIICQRCYTVTCKNCTFTGSGYSNAKFGRVPAGATITVKADNGYTCTWTINGTHRESLYGRSTITWTINTNTTIEAYMIIN